MDVRIIHVLAGMHRILHSWEKYSLEKWRIKQFRFEEEFQVFLIYSYHLLHTFIHVDELSVTAIERHGNKCRIEGFHVFGCHLVVRLLFVHLLRHVLRHQ